MRAGRHMGSVGAALVCARSTKNSDRCSRDSIFLIFSILLMASCQRKHNLSRTEKRKGPIMPSTIFLPQRSRTSNRPADIEYK